MLQILREGGTVIVKINSGTVESREISDLPCLAFQLLIPSVEKPHKRLCHYRLILWFCE